MKKYSPKKIWVNEHELAIDLRAQVKPSVAQCMEPDTNVHMKSNAMISEYIEFAIAKTFKLDSEPKFMKTIEK